MYFTYFTSANENSRQPMGKGISRKLLLQNRDKRTSDNKGKRKCSGRPIIIFQIHCLSSLFTVGYYYYVDTR